LAQRPRHPHHPNPAAETLQELEQLGDQLARVVSENPRPILVGIGAILAAAAIAGGVLAWQRSSDRAATEALEEARGAFLEAMGSSPGAVQISEPANPETARRAREDAAKRYVEVAEAHAGSAAGVLARLEAGDLRQALGEPEAALEQWRQAGAGADSDSPLRAMAFERIATAEENAGRYAEAAAAWTTAGEVEDYPLRWVALAQAGRTWLEAGDADKARALYTRIQTEAPDVRLPEYLIARLRELATEPAPAAPAPAPN
jgi:tetratricopeptide (TPR) repeat protein